MSSTRMQLRAGDVADDVHHFGFAGPLAALVDDGERRVDALGEPAGAHHAADVGRDDHQIVDAERPPGCPAPSPGPRTDCRSECRRSPGSAPACRSSVSTRSAPARSIMLATSLAEIGVRARLAVLPRIAEIGDDRRDAPRRRALQRVDHDQQLHQVVVGGRGGRLDDEHVLAAHVLLHLDEDFHVSEAPNHTFGKRSSEVASDCLGERTVAVACNQFHASVPCPPSPAKAGPPSSRGLLTRALGLCKPDRRVIHPVMRAQARISWNVVSARQSGAIRISWISARA